MDKRTDYFDYLRVCATFAVMVLHISAHNWDTADVSSYEWNVLNIFDSSVRWAVPVFVMISGALFLGGQQSARQIYKKNLFRIATAFAFWSVLYAVVVYFATGCGIKNAAAEAFTGHYHLWFLFMLAGLYLIVPFLRKLTEQEELVKYFLLLSFLFSFVIPQCAELLKLYSDFAGSVAVRMIDNMDFHFAKNYVFYFVLGHYLNQICLEKKTKRGIYLLGAGGFLATIVLTVWVSVRKGTAQETFYGYFTVNVMLESVMVFVLAKQCVNKMHKDEKRSNAVRKLAECSFGAYLVHALVIEALHLLGMHSLYINPVLAVPLMSVLVFAVSYAASFGIHCIPGLRRYVV